MKKKDNIGPRVHSEYNMWQWDFDAFDRLRTVYHIYSIRIRGQEKEAVKRGLDILKELYSLIHPLVYPPEQKKILKSFDRLDRWIKQFAEIDFYPEFVAKEIDELYFTILEYRQKCGMGVAAKKHRPMNWVID